MNVYTGPELFAELSKLIELPDNVVSLTLRLGIDRVAEVECVFHAQRRVIDITKLTSVAREYAPDFETVIKRFRLVEITKPEPGPARPSR